MDILIYFRRYNNCLEYAVKTFERYNKHCRMHLITDNVSTMADKFKGFANVIVEDVAQYGDAEENLRRVYRHQSLNPGWFEFPSLSRWCVFSEYARKNGFKEVFTSDWDVLYYTDIAELAERYRGNSFTVTNGTCGGSSYWFDIDELHRLPDMIMEFYTNPNSTLRAHIAGNISDMSFLQVLVFGRKVFDGKTIINDECMDDNILGTADWESEQPVDAPQGMKKLKVVGDRVYCFNTKLNKDIRLLSNHFAGFTRQYTPKLLERLRIL